MNLGQILHAMENTLYSEAIQNYLYAYTNNPDLKAYLEILKNSSTQILEDLPEKLSKSIKLCKNIGIKYLLMSIQLDISRFLSEFGATELREKQKILNRKLYLKLIKKIGKIPEPCRKIVGRTLKLNKAYDYKGDLKEFRTWSIKHLENDSDANFKTFSNAVRLSDATVIKASEEYYRAFQEALNQSDPFRILTGLNNAVVYIREANLNKAIEISKELSFYFGFYGEVHHINLIVARTLMQCAKQNKNYNHFFEAIVIMDYYYERLIKPIPSLKKMYYPMIRIARLNAFVRKKKTIKCDEVSNSKLLQTFLKRKIGKTNEFIKQNKLPTTTVYRVLNGETPVVMIKTLKKFIMALGIKTSFENPKEINYVLRIMKAEETFEKHVEKIQELSNDELTKLLIRGIFITLTEESLDYQKMLSLVRKRVEMLEYIKQDILRIMFINRCFYDDYGFYKGRQLLFKQLNEHTRSKLIQLYTSLKTDNDIELVSRYFREYCRVSSVRLDSNVELVLEKRTSDPDYKIIFSFCKEMKLKELEGYLCTFFFEAKERKHLIQIFTKNL